MEGEYVFVVIKMMNEDRVDSVWMKASPAYGRFRDLFRETDGYARMEIVRLRRGLEYEEETPEVYHTPKDYEEMTKSRAANAHELISRKLSSDPAMRAWYTKTLSLVKKITDLD